MKSLILILMLLSSEAALRAQSAAAVSDKTLPSGKLLVTNLGESAQWVVTVVPVSSKTGSIVDGTFKAPTGPITPPQTILLTKTKQILWVRTTSGKQVVEDRWIFGSRQVVTAPDTAPYISRPFGGAVDVSYANSDFPELAWLAPSKFDGIIEDKTTGKKMMIFKGSLVARDVDGNQAKTSAVAMIDFDTRLPISFQEDGVLRTYEIKPAPTAMLTVPDNVQQTLNLETKNDAIVNRAPVRP